MARAASEERYELEVFDKCFFDKALAVMARDVIYSKQREQLKRKRSILSNQGVKINGW